MIAGSVGYFGPCSVSLQHSPGSWVGCVSNGQTSRTRPLLRSQGHVVRKKLGFAVAWLRTATEFVVQLELQMLWQQMGIPCPQTNLVCQGLVLHSPNITSHPVLLLPKCGTCLFGVCVSNHMFKPGWMHLAGAGSCVFAGAQHGLVETRGWSDFFHPPSFSPPSACQHAGAAIHQRCTGMGPYPPCSPSKRTVHECRSGLMPALSFDTQQALVRYRLSQVEGNDADMMIAVRGRLAVVIFVACIPVRSSFWLDPDPGGVAP